MITFFIDLGDKITNEKLIARWYEGITWNKRGLSNDKHHKVLTGIRLYPIAQI